ncbi:MAG: stage III sporulation protein AB [Bacillota bacterium]|jgi:stage III sporulation protein AB|nr:MAG: stage III sporulation protein AB [Bacillota bacterium]
MLKTVGFMAIVAASSLAGNLVASSLGARVRQLGQLRVGLHLLESEVSYALGALPGALGRVAGAVAPPVDVLFARTAAYLGSGTGMSAGEAWKTAARDVFPGTALEAGDMDVVLTLASHLGLTDRDDQVRHLRLAGERLAVKEDEARGEQRSLERMWRYLGVLGGLALGIVFL